MNISTAQDQFISNAKKILQKKQFKIHETTPLKRGAFYSIFFIQDNSQNELMVKAICLNQCKEGNQISTELLSYCIQEALILSNLSHSAILKCVSHFQEGNIFFIIMERSLLTLQDFFQNNLRPKNDNNNVKSISEEQFFDFAGQLVNGIEYLHKKGIILKSMNPSNIFVFPKDQLKLSVLRITSTLFEKEKHSLFKDSLMYFPPEIMKNINSSEINKDEIKKKKITKTMKSDIWALGITLLQIFGTKEYILIALSCGYQEFTEEPNTSPKINQFLRFLLKKAPDERPNIETIREMLCNLDPKYHSKVLMKRAIWLRDKELDFDEAESLFRRSIEEDPTNSYAYSNLALSFYRRQDSYLQFKIKQNIETALQFNPNNEEAIILSSLQIKDEQQSEEMRQKALSINNTNPYVLNTIGYFLLKKNQLEYAEQYLKLAIKADENYGRAYCCLGDLYEKRKQFQLAINSHKQGIGRDYADSILISSIGVVLIDCLNQKSLGEKYLNFSDKLNPRCHYTKYQLGQYFYYDVISYEKALPYFNELVKQCPGKSDYRHKLSKTLWKLKKYSESEVQMREAVNISTDRDNLLFLGFITGDQGKEQECIDAFEQVIKLNPNDASLHGCYAEYLEKLGKLNESIMQYQRSEEIEHDESKINHITRIRLLLNQRQE